MFVVDQHPSTRMPPAISHRSHQSPPVKPPNLTSFTNKLKLQKKSNEGEQIFNKITEKNKQNSRNKKRIYESKKKC